MQWFQVKALRKMLSNDRVKLSNVTVYVRGLRKMFESSVSFYLVSRFHITYGLSTAYRTSVVVNPYFGKKNEQLKVPGM